MYSLCDSIEKYFIRLIDNSMGKTITIQRGKVAEEFDCAPSQINYVLTTRFNVFKGYIVESRRGGSGYVKIQKISIDRLEPVVNYLEMTEKDLRESDVEDILKWLVREEYITPREGSMMRAIMVDALNSFETPSLPTSREKNQLRSSLLREMLLEVLKAGS